MAKQIKGRKFRAIEKNAEDAPVKDIKWEGEEVAAMSDTKITQDLGTGQEIVIRFFEFGVNEEAFKQHTPTTQELFDAHRAGMEALLWRDGLKPHEAIEPRFMFSKNRKFYRFIITAVPRIGNVMVDKPLTLSQILNKT
jgi:uncharacterized Fe-S cluster-containing radical SAM superfamily protein